MEKWLDRLKKTDPYKLAGGAFLGYHLDRGAGYRRSVNNDMVYNFRYAWAVKESERKPVEVGYVYPPFRIPLVGE